MQFDNAPLFQGAITYAGKLGRVVRLCLQLGVTPVFAPPRETGFQAAIESCNARWQAKVWHRFEHADMAALKQRSSAYVQACEIKAQERITTARHLRRVCPEPFAFDAKAPLKDTVIFLRRSDEVGRVTVMGRRYEVSADWQHRLVRAEVNFTEGGMKFFALRRAAHTPRSHCSMPSPMSLLPSNQAAYAPSAMEPPVADCSMKSAPSPDYPGNC